MAAFPTCIAWPLSFVEIYQGIILAVDQIKNFTQQIVARYSYFLWDIVGLQYKSLVMKCPFRKNININIVAILLLKWDKKIGFLEAWLTWGLVMCVAKLLLWKSVMLLREDIRYSHHQREELQHFCETFGLRA